MISPHERTAFEQHFVDQNSNSGMRVPSIFELGVNGNYIDKRVKQAFSIWTAARAYPEAPMPRRQET